jgi:hypothetical protein
MELAGVKTAIQVLHFIEEQSEPNLSVPLPVPSACAGGHETSDRLHSAAVIAQWQRRAFDLMIAELVIDELARTWANCSAALRPARVRRRTAAKWRASWTLLGSSSCR